jgi:uncharacterized protein
MKTRDKHLDVCGTGRGAGSARRGARPGTGRDGRRSGTACATRVAGGVAAAGAAAAAYMMFEAQWVQCRQADLEMPSLPAPWSGLTILHLADIHAGAFRVNELSLAKVVEWAAPLRPDLVFLTGDNLGDPRRAGPCLELLSHLEPPMGMFAVTGNHEYGLSKGPLARPRDSRSIWAEAGITLLTDSCVWLPPRAGTEVVLCGADFVTGGFGLVSDGAPPEAGAFPILLVHEPPEAGSPLFGRFPLAFAGHTHGGQLRMITPFGMRVVSREEHGYLLGVHPWGPGTLVVTRGIGTSFLPFRLLTRPEATLWRLVYTSRKNQGSQEGNSEQGDAHD